MTTSPFPEPDPEARRPSARSSPGDDLSLALQVVDVLSDDARLFGAQISVDVKNRVVILEGRVLNAQTRARVSEDVWSVDGVHDVCNVLQLPPWS